MQQADLLDIWDASAATRAPQRALALAAGLGGLASPEEAGLLPVGERDAILMTAHLRLFAAKLDLMSVCPGCAEPAGFEVPLGDLLAQHGIQDWPLSVPIGDMMLTCRRPSTADLDLAWKGGATLEEARLRLCALCTEEPVPLDDATIDRISAALAEADPLADIEFVMTCPDCATQWAVPFDPSQTLWRALNGWACGLLDDVGRLARHYGWSQRDILDMSRNRRQFYLDAIS